MVPLRTTSSLFLKAQHAHLLTPMHLQNGRARNSAGFWRTIMESRSYGGAIFNPVGPGQDERHLCGWLGRQVAAIAVGAQPPTFSVGPLHTTRDFIDVRDVASALQLLATKGAPGRVYNVASGEETSGEAILNIFVALAGLTARITIERRRARPSDIGRLHADISSLLALGYHSRYDLRKSLADVLSYYQTYVSTKSLGVQSTSVRVNSRSPAPPRPRGRWSEPCSPAHSWK